MWEVVVSVWDPLAMTDRGEMQVRVQTLTGSVGEVRVPRTVNNLELAQLMYQGLRPPYRYRFEPPQFEYTFWRLAIDQQEEAPNTIVTTVTLIATKLRHEDREAARKAASVVHSRKEGDWSQAEPQLFYQYLALPSYTFPDQFNQAIDNVVLPPYLKTLTFGNNFNTRMDNAMLPSSLKSLTFGGQFHMEMFLFAGALPSGLQNLTFGHDFDNSMDGVALPSGLQTLTFGENFNTNMENASLPSGLQTLTFGRDFNQSMAKVTFPSKLQNLTFGKEFNQNMDDGPADIIFRPGLQPDPRQDDLAKWLEMRVCTLRLCHMMWR